MIQQFWAALNTPIGVTIVSAVVVFILGRIFTQVPKAQALFETYKGPLMDAVRWAEKAIPDDSPNTGLQRFDAALKYVLKVQPQLANVKETDLHAMINQAHTEAEEKEKI